MLHLDILSRVRHKGTFPEHLENSFNNSKILQFWKNIPWLLVNEHFWLVTCQTHVQWAAAYFTSSHLLPTVVLTSDTDTHIYCTAAGTEDTDTHIYCTAAGTEDTDRHSHLLYSSWDWRHRHSHLLYSSWDWRHRHSHLLYMEECPEAAGELSRHHTSATEKLMTSREKEEGESDGLLSPHRPNRSALCC